MSSMDKNCIGEEPDYEREYHPPGLKFWFDTEFIEDGRTIDLMSIGVVCEDGREYYAEPLECDLSRASDWVKENVIPHLSGEKRTRLAIRDDLLAFMGEKPEIWAYYADYDWIALCQLFGTMMDLPKGWPMFCRDLKQLAGDTPLIPQTSTEHHALSDARWTREAWLALNRNAYGSTDALRSALAEGRQAAVELASLMREGAHDAEEIKWCKVVDKIDAALSASPAPSTEGLREALAWLADAVETERRTYEDHRRLFDPEGPIPADKVVARTGDAFDAAYARTNEAVKQARTALAGVTAPSEVDGK